MNRKSRIEPPVEEVLRENQTWEEGQGSTMRAGCVRDRLVKLRVEILKSKLIDKGGKVDIRVVDRVSTSHL